MPGPACWNAQCVMLVLLVGLWGAAAKSFIGVAAESLIEEVSDRQLEKLVDENDFVAVAWISKSCKYVCRPDKYLSVPTFRYNRKKGLLSWLGKASKKTLIIVANMSATFWPSTLRQKPFFVDIRLCKFIDYPHPSMTPLCVSSFHMSLMNHSELRENREISKTVLCVEFLFWYIREDTQFFRLIGGGVDSWKNKENKQTFLIEFEVDHYLMKMRNINLCTDHQIFLSIHSLEQELQEVLKIPIEIFWN